MTVRTMQGQVFKGTLGSGTAVEKNVGGGWPLPMTVWVDPAGGDTVRVRYSTDGGVNWRTSTIAGATAYQETVFDSGITALEFQRTGGSGTTSAYGAC